MNNKIILITGTNAGIGKSILKLLEKEKCIDKGVTIGGNHAEEYMPQAINFFKENLL